MTTKKKKKRSPFKIIVLILLLLICAVSCLIYYFYRQPQQKLKSYLKHCQELNFEEISKDVSTHDISPLENAGITDPSSETFFKKAASLITFKVEKTNFHLKSATVRTTIEYPDASEIFKNAFSDYAKHAAASTFNEENAADFSTYLNEKTNELGSAMASTSIDFQLVKNGSEWFIDSINDDMVQVLSANIHNTKEELKKLMAETLYSDAEASIPTASPEERMDLTTAQFTVQFSSTKVGTDMNGIPCLYVYYEYKNLRKEPSSAMVDVNLSAYQNGTALQPAILAAEDATIKQYTSTVESGQSISVCQVFSLLDTTSPVTLKASEAYSLDGISAVQLIEF